MIQRSRFFKAASWMCIVVAVNLCTYEIVLGRGSESTRPGLPVMAPERVSGKPDATRAASYIQLAQSDTTAISVKGEYQQPGRIRFVLLPGRVGLSTLWPKDRPAPSTTEDNSGSDRDRAIAGRVWLLPGREGLDTPGTRRWRGFGPEAARTDGDVLPLSVTDEPRAGENRPDPARPVYKKWWFWAIGVVVVGTTTALLRGSDATDDHHPRRDLPDFPGPPDR
jgi:hypothetical protein